MIYFFIRTISIYRFELIHRNCLLNFKILFLDMIKNKNQKYINRDLMTTLKLNTVRNTIVSSSSVPSCPVSPSCGSVHGNGSHSGSQIITS